MGQVIYESGKRLERLVENFLIYAQLELLAADPQKLAALRRKRTDTPARPGRKPARAPRPSRRGGRGTCSCIWPMSRSPISEDYLAKIVDELVQNAFKFSEPAARP